LEGGQFLLAVVGHDSCLSKAQAMKAARILAAGVIGAVSLFALRSCVVIPAQCMTRVKTVEDQTRLALEASGNFQAVVLARQNIDVLRRCENHYPLDVNVYMLEGANFQIMQQLDRASAAYEKALRIDRRPEIYFNLGVVQLELKDREKARANFISAVTFAPTMLEEIPDITIREEVKAEIVRKFGEDWLG
jgi:tetratricopeptide (TPR) repeat protein